MKLIWDKNAHTTKIMYHQNFKRPLPILQSLSPLFQAPKKKKRLMSSAQLNRTLSFLRSTPHGAFPVIWNFFQGQCLILVSEHAFFALPKQSGVPWSGSMTPAGCLRGRQHSSTRALSAVEPSKFPPRVGCPDIRGPLQLLQISPHLSADLAKRSIPSCHYTS